VRAALQRLRPKAAAVLVLRYSGLSYAEVGAALKVGTGQVGTLLRRAEQALKKELEVGTPL
jgi:RNA polymerase sigma-70 factor (ECF subfamily)